MNLIFYVKALRDIPVALAYPISIGLSAPGVSLGALLWFGERVTPLQWIVNGYAVLENRFDDGIYISDHRAVVGDLLLT